MLMTLPNTVYFPMWDQNKHMISLKDILKCVEDNDLDWILFQITGVGTTPNQIPLPEFERSLDESLAGYRMSWPEMLMFAHKIEQVWDCLIIGCIKSKIVSRNDMDLNTFDLFDYIIEAEDSSLWTISAKNQEIINTLKSKFCVENI